MHKNISILIAFFCSASLLFAAQENVIRSLQGPSTGVKPTVVHPLSLPYNAGPGNENVKAIPVGEYGEQEETIEQEKLRLQQENEDSKEYILQKTDEIIQKTCRS